MEREFSFSLGGDRIRGRWDRVDIEPADDETGPPAGIAAPAPHADTIAPTFELTGRERVTITDYKTSDVRDPAKARQRARDSLQLQIYAMAYEAVAGRLPDAVQLHFLDTGVIGRAEVDARRLARGRERIAVAAAGIRAGDESHGRARPPAATAPSDRSARPAPRRDAALAGIAAITFDFGNTLVPVGRDALRRVVELTADGAPGRRDDRPSRVPRGVGRAERQFRDNVPQFREVDLAERLVRVFARLRGMTAPPLGGIWDQERAAAFSTPAEIDRAIDVYSHAFVDGLPPVPGIGGLLAGLAAEGRRLAILSNWPLAATIDRYADARGWVPSLTAIVVSQRIGVIKPHAAIFAAARSALGDPEPQAILHVGDDWAADVVGAAAAGWKTAWVRDRPGICRCRPASRTTTSVPISSWRP